MIAINKVEIIKIIKHTLKTCILLILDTMYLKGKSLLLANEIRPILKYFVPAVCIFVTTVPKIVWVAYNFENIPYVLALDDVKSNLPQ